MSTQIISVGYERRDVDELIHILNNHHVIKLLDVRQIPISRKKGFSKGVLSELLEQAGIEYVHIRSAGNPHHKEKDDIIDCLQLYKQYLKNNPAVIKRGAAEISVTPTAVLCYEREQEYCHRRILLDELVHNGYHCTVIQIE